MKIPVARVLAEPIGEGVHAKYHAWIEQLVGEWAQLAQAKINKEFMMSGTLFTPWKLGKTEIRNRVVMAPMT